MLAHPMSNLAELVLLFAGLNVTNALVSGLLWFEHRTPLHRSFALMWFGSVLALAGNVLIPGRFMIPIVAAPTLFMNLCLTDIIRRAVGARAAWRVYLAIFAVAVVLSVVFEALHAPFWLVSLPVMVPVGLPLLHVAFRAVRARGWGGLSMTSRSVLVIAVVIGLHELDYPFLRLDPHFAALGFVFAILIAFALSISVPAVILEASTAEVRRLEAEVIRTERLAALGEAAAVVAHEVRNPLATLANITQLLRLEPAPSERAVELLEMQQSEVDRLDRMVQDLLCYTRPLQPRLSSMELTQVIRNVAALAGPRAAEGRVRLEVELGPQHHLQGDLDHLHMALANVLQNAIEASPQGSCVRVEVHRGEGQVSVRVDDEGGGVPAGVIERVFEPFFTTRARGSGLGLAITQRIMKAHGGEVRVSNLARRGARFELVFGHKPPFPA